jgi:L-fuculose-phosphate aldolase
MKEEKIRFNSIFVSNQIPSDPNIQELKEWCGQFQKNGLIPKVGENYTGNLSFRSKKGFIITASGLKNKRNLTHESFVYIKDYDNTINSIFVEGIRLPSSESIMHYLIYKFREEINSVFHGHSEIILNNAKKLRLSITETEYESGSLELAKEVLKALRTCRIIILKNHGFVSVGKSMEEAGQLALSVLQKVK